MKYIYSTPICKLVQANNFIGAVRFAKKYQCVILPKDINNEILGSEIWGFHSTTIKYCNFEQVLSVSKSLIFLPEIEGLRCYYWNFIFQFVIFAFLKMHYRSPTLFLCFYFWSTKSWIFSSLKSPKFISNFGIFGCLLFLHFWKGIRNFQISDAEFWLFIDKNLLIFVNHFLR